MLSTLAMRGMGNNMVDKWEFLKGKEAVYSSALDIFGTAENAAWDASVQAVGKCFARSGWDTKLSELTGDQMQEFVMTVTLEFEKVMKAHKSEQMEIPGQPDWDSDETGPHF